MDPRSLCAPLQRPAPRAPTRQVAKLTNPITDPPKRADRLSGRFELFSANGGRDANESRVSFSDFCALFHDEFAN
jgi:hypothetical protein